MDQRIQGLEQRIRILESKFDYVDNFLNNWVPKVNKKLGIGQEHTLKADQESDSFLNQSYFLAKINSQQPMPKQPKRNTGFQTRKIF